MNDEASESGHVDQMLQKFGASRIIIAHTPMPGVVYPRFDGRVLLADVGMSEYYGGWLACVVIENGEFFALHRGQKVPLPGEGDKARIEYLKAVAEIDPQPAALFTLIENLEGPDNVPADVPDPAQ